MGSYINWLKWAWHINTQRAQLRPMRIAQLDVPTAIRREGHELKRLFPRFMRGKVRANLERVRTTRVVICEPMCEDVNFVQRKPHLEEMRYGYRDSCIRTDPRTLGGGVWGRGYGL